METVQCTLKKSPLTLTIYAVINVPPLAFSGKMLKQLWHLQESSDFLLLAQFGIKTWTWKTDSSGLLLMISIVLMDKKYINLAICNMLLSTYCKKWGVALPPSPFYPNILSSTLSFVQIQMKTATGWWSIHPVQPTLPAWSLLAFPRIHSTPMYLS